jgi:hypothetical protein
MADRFYGTPALIAFATAQGWGYRLGIERSLIVWAGDPVT